MFKHCLSIVETANLLVLKIEHKSPQSPDLNPTQFWDVVEQEIPPMDQITNLQ